MNQLTNKTKHTKKQTNTHTHTQITKKTQRDIKNLKLRNDVSCDNNPNQIKKRKNTISRLEKCSIFSLGIFITLTVIELILAFVNYKSNMVGCYALLITHAILGIIVICGCNGVAWHQIKHIPITDDWKATYVLFFNFFVFVI